MTLLVLWYLLVTYLAALLHLCDTAGIVVSSGYILLLFSICVTLLVLWYLLVTYLAALLHLCDTAGIVVSSGYISCCSSPFV